MSLKWTIGLMRRSHQVDIEMEVIMDDIQKQDHSQSHKTGNLGNSGNLLFEDIVNSVKDPIFQSIPETKKTYENRSI